VRLWWGRGGSLIGAGGGEISGVSEIGGGDKRRLPKEAIRRYTLLGSAEMSDNMRGDSDLAT
jgi:hypothetical protein